jgi:hypothetical protein
LRWWRRWSSSRSWGRGRGAIRCGGVVSLEIRVMGLRIEILHIILGLNLLQNSSAPMVVASRAA